MCTRGSVSQTVITSSRPVSAERLRRVTLGSEVTQSHSCVIPSHLQSHPVGDPYARPAVGEAEVQLTCPKS